MKNLIIILNTLFLTSILFAHEEYPEHSSYEIISNLIDTNLGPNKAEFVFIINGLNYEANSYRIVYSINKKIDTVLVKSKERIVELVNPGKYDFKFYYNAQFREIFIPKTEIKGSHRITISLYFNPIRTGNQNVKKPVIYLYPEVSTNIQIKIKPKGDLTFSYPEYNDGWNVNAEPNGELTLNSHKLNYLFWESTQALTINDFNTSNGFVVSKETAVSFLEEKLTKFGFNTKEMADFITFWGPQLIQNDHNFVQFIFNKDADIFAELSIEPKPSHVYRIYLVFFDLKDLKFTEIRSQEIPVMNRDGFTVLEWGGVELNDFNDL